ncbi:MAG: hypothetical protein IPO81_28080 [Kouleothrix sp.]|nr:hypothetical protein [Kouleothrix sp.]
MLSHSGAFGRRSHLIPGRACARSCEITGDFPSWARQPDGEVAVHLAKELKPDVILIDINMPR